MTPLDEALERFAVTGPEFGPGLSNHGPMATEALVALGRADALPSWADWYVTRLTEHPQIRNSLDAADWREALGDIGRVGDWIGYLEREVRERPWRDLLETWVSRLAPGIMSGATHGMLRTAHVVRSLDQGENATRLREFAEGLGYWAARYQELPSAGCSAGTLGVNEALALVERVDPERRKYGLIFDAVRVVDPGAFAPVLNYVATTAMSANSCRT